MENKNVLQTVLNIIQDVIGESVCDGRMGLEEMGLDSITYIKMIVLIEKEFQIEFDDNKLLPADFFNVYSLVEYIEQKQQNKYHVSGQ